MARFGRIVINNKTTLCDIIEVLLTAVTLIQMCSVFAVKMTHVFCILYCTGSVVDHVT
jgi:hypothetical protein